MEAIKEMMEWVKENNPELYWKVAVEEHEKECGEHYDEEFAEYDISNISYIDNKGVVHKGSHWTLDQVKSSTLDFVFPDGTNDWDKWVAFNVFYSDTNRVLNDEQIIATSYEFFFNDKDFEGNKIWHYMRMASNH